MTITSQTPTGCEKTQIPLLVVSKMAQKTAAMRTGSDKFNKDAYTGGIDAIDAYVAAVTKENPSQEEELKPIKNILQHVHEIKDPQNAYLEAVLRSISAIGTVALDAMTGNLKALETTKAAVCNESKLTIGYMKSGCG